MEKRLALFFNWFEFFSDFHLPSLNVVTEREVVCCITDSSQQKHHSAVLVKDS
jgi:hypothetical protein